MKKMLNILLVVILLAGCGRKQLSQSVDKVIGETIVNIPKQTKSYVNIETVNSIVGCALVCGVFACKVALRTNSPKLLFVGTSVVACCGVILIVITP